MKLLVINVMIFFFRKENKIMRNVCKFYNILLMTIIAELIWFKSIQNIFKWIIAWLKKKIPTANDSLFN